MRGWFTGAVNATAAVILGLVVVLVALLGLGYLLLQRLRRTAVSAGRALADELARDPAVRGPEPAEYAGGTAEVLRERSRGVLVLTGTRLLFRELSGHGVDVPLRGVEVSLATDFDGMRRLPRRSPDAGREHLVVRGPTATTGFLVEEAGAWREAVDAAATGSGGAAPPANG